MLRGIRKASANWIGKTIMAVVVALLVGAFGIWGINDIFRGFGQNRLAKIGSIEIGIEQFRQLYNDRLQQISRRAGRPLTPAQAHELGLDRQILGQLIGEFALDEDVRRLRLGIPDSDVTRAIMTNPAFQNINGQFDHDRFLALIRDQGFTEQRFVIQLRRDVLRRQLVETVSGSVPAPQTEIDVINRFQNEQRSIEYVALEAAQAGDVPNPSDEELAQYFDKRKVFFRAPEYRKIVVIALTPSELAKWIEVSDEDAKRDYDEHHDHYVTPERRHLQQIVFPTIEEAQAASDRLKQGLTFEALAAERKLKESDIDLGTLGKANVVDPAMADAAFALKEGETSAPVKGRFGIFLVHVVKVEPERVQSFADVEAAIKRDLALARAKDQILSMHDKIEDARAAGDTLSEAAKKLSVEARTIEAVDRSGRGPDGMAVNIPGGAGTDLLASVFSTEVGVDADPLQVQGGFVWYEVLAITPSRERPLNEVKDQVAARWRDDEIAKRLRTKAGEILDKLKAGQNLAEVAQAENLKVETAANLKRNNPTNALASRVIEQVFKTPKGEAGNAAGNRETEQLVFRVTDVVTPSVDMASQEGKRLADTVSASLSEDLMSQYVSRIEQDIGVDINEAALAQVFGTGGGS